jgi:hypothetical protein
MPKMQMAFHLLLLLASIMFIGVISKSIAGSDSKCAKLNEACTSAFDCCVRGANKMQYCYQGKCSNAWTSYDYE